MPSNTLSQLDYAPQSVHCVVVRCQCLSMQINELLAEVRPKAKYPSLDKFLHKLREFLISLPATEEFEVCLEKLYLLVSVCCVLGSLQESCNVLTVHNVKMHNASLYHSKFNNPSSVLGLSKIIYMAESSLHTTERTWYYSWHESCALSIHVHYVFFSPRLFLLFFLAL